MTPTQLRMLHDACSRRDAIAQLRLLRTIHAGVAPTSMVKDGHITFNELTRQLGEAAGF